MGSDRRTLNEFLAGLVFLGLVAAVPFVVSNAYWQGVIVLSTYFAIQAGAWTCLPAIPANSRWRPPPSE